MKHTMSHITLTTVVNVVQLNATASLNFVFGFVPNSEPLTTIQSGWIAPTSEYSPAKIRHSTMKITKNEKNTAEKLA